MVARGTQGDPRARQAEGSLSRLQGTRPRNDSYLGNAL